MKKTLIAFTLLFLSFAIIAQEDAEKALKAANKALDSYNLDPSVNAEKLVVAKQQIDVAINGETVKPLAKAWILKGQVYNTLAAKDQATKMVNKNAKTEYPASGLIATEAFNKGFSLAEKKYEKKDALRGLQEAVNYLNNDGNSFYNDRDFAKAYTCFNNVILIRDLLKANGEDDIIPKPEDLNNQYFIAGFCALNAEMMPEAKAAYTKLYNNNYLTAEVYEGLYKIKSVEKDATAIKTLEEGRAKFPDDTNLLFAEINYYLEKNQLNVLTDRLKKAIQKEPSNTSLYVTTGNVYDNLLQQAIEKGETDKAKEYEAEAINYYSQGLQKDDKNFDAIYSMGTLYYNKAAVLSKELQKLDADYSKEGIRKYDAKKAEVFAQFDNALPYFQKAEALNPNDRNTLIALREIYAKKDDLVISNEFKKRLENIDNKINNTSYFKK